MLRRLLALLLVTVAVPLVLVGPAHAAAAAPGTISGTITTADGGPFPSAVKVTLYSWFPAGDASYPTPQVSQIYYPTGSTLDYSFLVQGAGFYTVQARPAGTDYGITWLGSGADIAQAYGDPGVVLVPEEMTPQTGQDFALLRTVTLSGTVRGGHGQPLGQVPVTAKQWLRGTTQDIPGSSGTSTDSAGHYRMAIVPGTQVSLSVTHRAGYDAWVLGDDVAQQTDDNTLTVDGPTTQDIDLTESWSDVGSSGAVQHDDYCLQNAGNGRAELPTRALDVWERGVVNVADAYADESSDPLGAASTLVPYFNGLPSALTWGVSGSTLCAVWRSTLLGTAFQAIVVDRGHGNADVTYNYGTIPTNPSTVTAVAGWSSDSGTTVLPGEGADAYADSNDDTGLVNHSQGSDVLGRYVFGYDGLAVRPPNLTAPRLTSTAVVGQPLTADPGAWDVPAGSHPTFRYLWLRDGEAFGAADSPTYTPMRGDVGHDLSARVTLLAGDAYEEGYDEVTAASRVAVATSTVQLSGPSKVTKGKHPRLEIVVRMPGLVPEGTVTLTDNGLPLIGTRGLDSDGRRVVRLPRLVRGVHQLRAVYSGDGTTATATSAPVRLRVVRR